MERREEGDGYGWSVQHAQRGRTCCVCARPLRHGWAAGLRGAPPADVNFRHQCPATQSLVVRRRPPGRFFRVRADRRRVVYLMQREKSGVPNERQAAESENEQQLLRAVHETLDVLESRLQALPPMEQCPRPIDLVLQLRREVIETFSESPADGS